MHFDASGRAICIRFMGQGINQYETDSTLVPDVCLKPCLTPINSVVIKTHLILIFKFTVWIKTAKFNFAHETHVTSQLSLAFSRKLITKAWVWLIFGFSLCRERKMTLRLPIHPNWRTLIILRDLCMYMQREIDPDE